MNKRSFSPGFRGSSLLLVCLCCCCISRAQYITIIAGTGTVYTTGSFSGDGGPGTAAQLFGPESVVADRYGNVFIGDHYNHRIRRVDTSGIITTFAGTSGGLGFGGDGGPASICRLSFAEGMCFDTSGNLYFADANNRRVRKIDTSGIVTTIAGTGTTGYSGDGGYATAATFANPSGMAINKRNGDIYVSDESNNSIRKITASGIITTYAGSWTGAAGFSGDGGQATAAHLDRPVRIALDTAGNLYIPDYNNHRIRKVNTFGVISTIAGTGGSGYGGDGGPATAAMTGHPTAVAINDSGTLFVAAYNGARVRKITTFGIISTVAGTGTGGHAGDGGPATAAQLSLPEALGLDQMGNLYIADWGTNRVRMICTVPNATFSGVTSVCSGASDTFTVNTKQGGIWTVGSTGTAIVDASGVITGISPGFAAVTYTVTNRCGESATTSQTIPVRTVPFVAPITGTIPVCPGTSIVLHDTSTGGIWSSSDTSLAGVSTTGTVVGVGSGTATISYTLTNGCGPNSATTSVSINPLPHAGTITGATTTICAGGATTTLSDTTSGGTWTSSAPSVASIASSGIVTGVSAGTSIISYAVTNSCGTAIATTSFSVNPLPYAGVITGTTSVCPGTSIALHDTTTGGIWSSSDTTLASVNTTGTVTGAASGTVAISYTVTNGCGSASATAAVTIDPLPHAGTITGTAIVCEGGSTTTLSDTISGGAWTSSAPSIASIASSGIVTGVSAGTSTISYTVTNSCGTATATTSFTVNPLPHAGAITGATAVCAGATTTLSDTTAGGAWSASNSHATIASTGILSGVTIGIDTVAYTVTNGCGNATVRHIVAVIDLPLVSPIIGSSSVCIGLSTTLMDAVSGGTWAASNSNAIVSSGVVTAIFAGTDTVSYTTTNMCGSSVATKIITVPPSLVPSVSATVGRDSIVCTGEGVMFSAIAINGGSAPLIKWFNSGIYVGTGATYSYIPANGDAISCTLVSNDSCALHDTFVSNTIVMSVSPAVIPFTVVTASPGNEITFPGQTVTFNVTLSFFGPSPVYQWFLNGVAVAGADSPSYSLNAAYGDSVYCMVTGTTTCGSPTYNLSNVIIIHPKPVAVNEQWQSHASFTCYPNPCKGQLTVEGAANCEVVFYNIVGMEVRRSRLMATKETLDISNLAPGVYAVALIDNLSGEKIAKRIVVEQ